MGLGGESMEEEEEEEDGGTGIREWCCWEIRGGNKSSILGTFF